MYLFIISSCSDSNICSVVQPHLHCIWYVRRHSDVQLWLFHACASITGCMVLPGVFEPRPYCLDECAGGGFTIKVYQQPKESWDER